MTKLGLLVGCVGVLALVSGCGGSDPAPAAPAAPAASAPVEATAPVEAVAPAEAPAAEAAAAAPAPAAAPAAEAAPVADGAVDGQLQKLVGTKWKWTDFDLHFKDEKTVSLNGGPLTMITGGKGLDATFSYVGGKLEVTAMGQTKVGTWDGEALVVDGSAATKVE